VVLAVDASGMARTIAAIAHGFRHFDSKLNLAGLICNRVGSHGHLDLLRTASAEVVPVLGGFPDDRAIAFPERHLGLLSAIGDAVPQKRFDAWAAKAIEWLDLDAILTIARAATPVPAFYEESGGAPRRCRIGIARDDAFHFYYEDNLRRLEIAGAELIDFSPIGDTALPEIDGLYFGGGYPEVAAARLSANRAMIEAVRAFAASGGPIYAECGGLMYLARAIRTVEGQAWPMLGLLPADAVMSDRLQALGYAEVTTTAPSILGPAGVEFRGHQFRYSTLEPSPSGSERIYYVRTRWGGNQFAEGYRIGNVIGSYVHAHWASNSGIPAALVQSCTQWRAKQQ
jgi:cobyrinic acid a,c-diamide synthase